MLSCYASSEYQDPRTGYVRKVHEGLKPFLETVNGRGVLFLLLFIVLILLFILLILLLPIKFVNVVLYDILDGGGAFFSFFIGIHLYLHKGEKIEREISHFRVSQLKSK